RGQRPRPLVHRRRGAGVRLHRRRRAECQGDHGRGTRRVIVGAEGNTEGLMMNHTPWGTAGPMPSSRYVMPQFEERTPYGFKRQDPTTRPFDDRVIFLGVQVDDTSADDVMAQLLVLESQDPDRDITLYINSPGGSFTALTAIYDTMQYVKPEIQTVCLGQAAS